MSASDLHYLQPPPTDSRWLIACLCAQWCGACREYRGTLQMVACEYPDHAFAWIDIEDDAELAGDIDIETFPTLLILDGAEVMFYGPVLPGADAFRRLLRALQDNGPQPGSLDEEVQALIVRLRG